MVKMYDRHQRVRHRQRQEHLRDAPAQRPLQRDPISAATMNIAFWMFMPAITRQLVARRCGSGSARTAAPRRSR